MQRYIVEIKEKTNNSNMLLSLYVILNNAWLQPKLHATKGSMVFLVC